jgi:hypothetical protein
MFGAAVCFAGCSFRRDRHSRSDDIRQFYEGLVTDHCRTVISHWMSIPSTTRLGARLRRTVLIPDTLV